VDRPAVTVTDAPEPKLTLLGTAVPEDLLDDADAPDPSGSAAVSPSPEPSATADTPIYRQNPIDGDTVNVLLVGLDARPEQQSGRSDTMMLISYNRKLHKVAMVSFMRDIWVPIDGHGWNRLNACYEYGGIGLTINTINKQFGLDIQNYIVIRFEEVENVIDKMGGIDVYLTKQEATYYNDTNYGVSLHEGMQKLSGALALIHARNRKIGSVDFDRTRRQRDVMMAIFTKLKSIKDPVKLAGIMQFAFKNVKTNMAPDLLFSLAMEGLSADGLDFTKSTIPIDGTWQYAYESGNCVISVDIQKNKNFLSQLLAWK
jgi:LCP family protein required for cell wall assembly